jgi:hypothetical protein
MRLSAFALLATTSCSSLSARGADVDEQDSYLLAHPNVESARELDQEGVRAFRDARYADSVRYFRAAFRLGGPASELWNIARGRERLDDPEGAAAAIEQYLALRALAPQDRAEAEGELRALRSRPSTLTVTTTPTGAIVSLDARQTLGSTPVTIEIPPGPHGIAVRREGYRTVTRSLEARFGRAVIVSLDLARMGK